MGAFADSLARGTDQTQAMLYGFAAAVGEAFSFFNPLKEWGEEGVRRNLIEAAENPPRVESFDDINSLADLGDYVIEALGENAPSLVAMLLPAAGAGTLAAKYGTQTIAKATLGKALRQKVGEQAFQEFAKERARNIAASTAAGGVSFGLNTGETYVSLGAEGVEGGAGTAFVSGALKSALDVFGLQRIFSAANKVGVAPKDFLEYADEVMRQTRLGATAEGATEGLQTIVDMAAIAHEKPDFDFFDADNLKDVVNATLKGGIAGGTFAGSAHAIANFQEYRAAVRSTDTDMADVESAASQYRQSLEEFTQRLIAATEPTAKTVEDLTPPLTPPRGGQSPEDEQRTLDEESLPWPESASALRAQINALVDPNNPKRGVLVTAGSQLPTDIPEGVEATTFMSKDGRPNLLLTYDKETTDEVRGKQSLSEMDLGALLYDRPAGKGITGEPVTVRGEDVEGNTVTEAVSDQDTLDEDVAAAEQRADTVTVEPLQATLNRRIAEINAEATRSPVPDDFPDVMSVVGQLPESYQREVTSALRGSPEQARAMAQGLTRMAQQSPDAISQIVEAARREEEQALAEESARSKHSELGEVIDVQNEVDTHFAVRVTEDDRSEPIIRAGEGYSTLEVAKRQMDALNTREPDPNRIRDIILRKDGRYVIQETPVANPALRPEETGNTKVAQARGNSDLKDSATGRPLAPETGASESRIVNLTLQKARTTGKVRKNRLERKAKDDLAKRRVQDSYITVTNPSGTVQPLTVSDLVTGGRELLAARGELESGGNPNIRDNAALEAMLGELAARGYNVNDALGPDGQLKPNLITRGRDLLDNEARDKPISRVRAAPKRTYNLNREARAKGQRAARDSQQVPVYLVEASVAAEKAAAALRKAEEEGASKGTIKRLESELLAAHEDFEAAQTRFDQNLEEVGRVGVEDEGSPTDDPNSIVTEVDAPTHEGLGKTAYETRVERERKARARAISERITKLSETGKNGTVTSWGKTITQEERDFVEAVLADAGITDVPVRIIDETTMRGALGAALLGPSWAPHLRARFKAEPNLRATTFNTRSGPVIVIRDGNENPTAEDKARKLLILGHETGHQILNTAWKNIQSRPAIAKRLRAAYEKELANTPVQQWQGRHGVAEWFADKVAARARVLSNKPTNRVDAIFRDVARTLRKYWNALTKKLPARFKFNRSFDAAMREMKNEEVFDTSALFVPTKQGAEEDIIIDTSQMKDHVSRGTLKKARAKLQEFLNGLPGLPGIKHAFTVDQRLRAMDPALADMLYQQSSTQPTVESYHTAVGYQRGKWLGAFFKIMREHTAGKDEAYMRKAFDEAGSDTPTADLKTELGKAVRGLLRTYYDDYLSKRLDIPFMENYFPRSYNRTVIAQRLAEFTAILKAHNVDNADDVANALRMRETPERYDSDKAVYESWQLERKITDKPELIKELIKKGFLNTSPVEGLYSYFYNTTRKAEWERLFGGVDSMTGNYSSNAKLREIIRKLPEEQQAEAGRLVMLSVYPQHGDPTNPWHRALSELKAYESFRVLLMSGVASIPELAGLILRTKGQMPFSEIRGHIFDTVKNFTDAKEVAEAMGLVRDAIGESMATEIYYDPIMEDGKGFFRKHLKYLFRWNGNDFLVNFTRTAGVAIGRSFLVTNARKALDGDATATRMLKELGITDPQSVMRWEELKFTPSAVGLSELDGAAVDMALRGLTRFIDESVIHPNASERPAWAGHPVGGLIFHLKAFAMSYNKVVMEGVYREMENRLAAGGGKEAILYMPFLMAAFGIFVALGAISDELRNRILSLGAEGTYGKHNGDASDMVTKWVDRAGFMSQPYNDILTARDTESVAYGLGPTAHHVYELVFEDYGDHDALIHALKGIPGLSQMPDIRKDIYQEVTE